MTQQLNILIIDDSEDDREMYRRLLKYNEDFDWIISEAETGKEGIEKYQNEEFHCVLLDYSLPGTNGLKILKSLKELDAMAAIIMLTGTGNEAIAVEALQNGAQDYLAKDNITAEALNRAITNALERISMRREIEQQREELVAFNRTLQHDFQSPLRSITNRAGYIRKDIQRQEYGELISHCDKIESASSHMSALINALANYTRLDGKVELETVCMKAVFDKAIDNIEFDIKERNSSITCENLPHAHGNSTLLTLLLQNLFLNALKYCQSGTPTVHVHTNQHEDNWQFSIKDNGIGMEKQYLGLIFEPFKRLHRKSEYAGTGLGLATCKKIIERHGGKIWCESTPGEGSTIFFTLPEAQTRTVEVGAAKTAAA